LAREEYEEFVDENGVKYIRCEPTPLALAQWMAAVALDAETREQRRDAMIMLVAQMRNNPEVRINDAVR
jgi:hypothetical protein